MDNLKESMATLRAAAGKLLAQVKTLDNNIAELRQQRSKLTDGVVSKADYMNYITAYFQKKSELFPRQLSRKFKEFPRDFTTLEKMWERDTNFPIPFLTGDHHIPAIITHEAIYFYFGDLIVERLGDVLDLMDWPGDAVPVDQRRALIAKLDVEIADVSKQRAALVEELEAAGITPS